MEKNKKILNERSSDELYHYRSLRGLIRMVRDNRINSSLVYSSDIESKGKLYKGYPYYISATSTKSFDFGYQSMIGLNARLKLNGRLINSDFKVSRVAFYPHSARMSDDTRNRHNDEMEERIYLNKPSIPFNRYVEEVTINIEPNDLDDNTKLLLYKLKEIINKWGIKFSTIGYDVEHHDTTPTIDKPLELPSIDLLGFVLGVNKVYSPNNEKMVINKLIELSNKEDIENLYSSAKNTEEYSVLTNLDGYIESIENGLEHPIIDFTIRKNRSIKDIIKGYFMSNIESFDRSNDLELYLIGVMGDIMRKFKIKNPSEFSEDILKR